ncbi:hypothetical protein [uncultured Duncaniella sp.]|uniref:hypothetical protein n=1 Tax=uncultured Duncaniella sp. TaxID=2768039 RepID=UPI000F4849FA|nr:hypothetical protein [uncultured Duncaniella sp.]ROT11694.1 hypothetical protein EEL50_13410 [Muribaculaceae bacterium Isolate-105 (HZI)]
MEKSEILQKIEALKEVLKKADDLLCELHEVAVEKVCDSRDALFDALDDSKDEEARIKFIRLRQENAYYENLVSKLENAGYQLSKGVIENIDKIN